MLYGRLLVILMIVFTGKLTWSYGRSSGAILFNSYFILKLQKARWLYNECGEPVFPNEIYLADLLKNIPEISSLRSILNFKPDIEKHCQRMNRKDLK